MLIASDRDYCAACDVIRKVVAENHDSFWVREKHHFAWIGAFIDHTGVNYRRKVEFTETSPRDLLEQRWGLPIPDWLTDELILSEELLDTNLPPGSHGTVEAALLAPLFGELGPKFPWIQAGSLAEKANAVATQAQLTTSAITRLAWESMLATWAASNGPSWAGEFCKRLRAEPAKLWRDLTIWRLLHDYPERQQEFALDPAAAAFVRTVPVEALKRMSMNPDGRSLALDQIQPFFEEARTAVVSRSKFEQLVGAVSGELKEEFNALTSLLEKAQFKIEESDVKPLVRRFSQCAQVDDAALARLALYVQPPKPADLDTASADAGAWLRWFHAQYMPYRWWQIERGHADAEVEETVGKFSEWYCRDFIQVHSDSQLSSVQVLAQWRPLILQDIVSLILLVDNLPWFFWEAFERALSLGGLHKHDSHDRFAPLPSHTSVCKPALITGRWDSAGSDYRKMLELRSVNEWNGKPVHYLSGVDQLNAMQSVPTPAVFLLNYLTADEALHSDLAAAGTTPADQLRIHYRNLGKAAGEFGRRASEGDRAFGVYVITDHGATHILGPERQSIDAKLSQRLFANEKHRSATLTAAEAAQVPDNLWGLGHRFDNPFVSDGTVHFIPRGHNTVASPNGRPLYCHGGATPEEVIIPCGVFRLYRASWVTPSVRFVDVKQKDGRAAFYVKRITNLILEIQNSNSDECRLDSITISPAVGEIRDFEKIAVGARSVGRTAMSLYFSAGATAVSTLTFEFTFRVAQEHLSRRVDLPAVISSAASGGTDLTNLS